MKKMLLAGFFALLTSVVTAEVPPEIAMVIEYARRFAYVEPTEQVHTLARYTARVAADDAARKDLARALLQAVTAEGTTPQGRTIICQQLALVAGDAEREVLRALVEKPELAADAKIAGRYVLDVGTLPRNPSQEECQALIADKNRARRVAGVASLARFHPDDAAPDLLKLVSDSDELVAGTAIQALARLDAEALAGRMVKLRPARQVVALQALQDNKAHRAVPSIPALLSSKDADVQRAAVAALGALGDARAVDPLLMVTKKNASLAGVVEDAIATLPDPQVDEQVLKAVEGAAPATAVILLQAAARRGSPGLGDTLLECMDARDAVVRTAALKLVGRIGTPAMYPQLVDALVREPTAAAESATATLAGRAGDATSTVTTLKAALASARTKPAATAALLRLLVATEEAAGLDVVSAYLTDTNTNLVDAAVRALASAQTPRALTPLDRVTGDAFTPVQRALALGAQLRLCPLAPDAAEWLTKLQPRATTVEEGRQFLAAAGAVTNADVRGILDIFQDRADLRAEYQAAMKAIQERLPPGVLRRGELAKLYAKKGSVVAYLDCGAAAADETGTVRIRTVRGKAFAFEGQLARKYPAAATVAFDSGQLEFQIHGLQTGHQYSVGFSWWDEDQQGRTMSCWLDGQRLIDHVPLPVGEVGPTTLEVPVSASAASDGSVSAIFRSEVAANALLGEIWVIDTGVMSDPEVRANPGAEKKVLIVTGSDYPGHRWQQTTPVLVSALGRDKRLEISVTEDPRFLGSPQLAGYNTIVLHYMNWEDPGPGLAAQENLRLCIERGAGLVLVHFACGAFQGWPDFVKMAGRVWDPKKRGHDPRGAFDVHVVDDQHPVTAGMSDFRTEDELYTCLAGDTPIHLLADAVSQVDQARYPMAFTLEYGLGRVFHSALGHDVRAYEGEVGRLYRRGTAWASGLNPE